jgi:hypothetical protein
MKLKSIVEDNDLGVLYHATDIANVRHILTHGLDPAKSTYADDERDNDDENFGPPYHFVYLTTNPGIAIKFAPGGEHSKSTNLAHKALFEVRLPPDLQEQLITNRGEFVRGSISHSATVSQKD